MRLRVIAVCALPFLAAAACATAGDEPGEESTSLAAAAEEVVGFLRGDVPFERLRLADTVTLRLAPEGGGASRALPGAALRDLSSWTIRAGSGQTYSLVPFNGPAELTLREGRHLNCMEGSLASVAPELESLPHVGTMLRPPGATSCLQSWNLTLVFEPGSDPPSLLAAVYDQWEW